MSTTITPKVPTETRTERKPPTSTEKWTEGWGFGSGLLGLREEMDRMFDSFLVGFPFAPTTRRMFEADPFRRMGQTFAGFGELSPKVDVTESDTGYKIAAELPGMDEKEVEVHLDDGVLTIKGEKKESKDEDKENLHLSERRYGAFRRIFRLPPNVAEGKVEAVFDKGVLTVSLPKDKDAAAPKTIPVKNK